MSANNDGSESQTRGEIGRVYERLCRIAAQLMRDERPGHTLWPTEVVHEAMARLLEQSRPREGQAPPPPGQVADLVYQVSRVMRQVLVDHARYRNAVKRGGGRGRVGLDQIEDIEAAIASPEFDWTLLDGALDALAQRDPRRHRVVTLRFFGGLDNRQIARELNLDERTVGRDWAAARLWIKKRLRAEA
jgi:RNA polymerase sigma factor (TIGR02999 family)